MAAAGPNAGPAPKLPSLLGYGAYGDPSSFQMPPERLFGVTVLAGFNFLVAGLFAIALLLIMGTGAAESGGAVVITALQMVAGLIIGVGLLRQQRWAYYLALVVYSLLLLFTLISIFAGPISGGTLISLIIPGLVLYYLAQRKVRRAFWL